MTFNEYQIESYKNIQPHSSKKDEVLNWSVGLSEEVGEVFNIIKHHYWGNESIDIEKLSKEIGDILWYLSALCTSFNINLDSVAKLNYEKLNYRFSNSFSNEKSQNRKENEMKFSDTEIYKNIINHLKLN